MKVRDKAACDIKLIALAAALAFAAPAQALDRDRITIAPFVSYAYDSNLFRLPDNVDPVALTGESQRSDRIFSTGLRVALDYPVSRQRFLADARVTRNDFQTFTFLDNTATDGRLLWRWQLGNDWSGDAGYNYSRALTSFGDFRVPVKNLESRHNPYLSAQYRFAASGRLRGRISHLETENSTAVRRPSDLQQTSYEAGFDFLPRSGNTIGATLRHTEGEYPNRTLGAGALFDNSFTQDDLEANVLWRLSGHSVVTGAVGYTTRKFDSAPQNDFDGPTGRLTWEYTPTGKLRFTTVIRREIVAYEDVNSSHALTDSVSVAADWAATARIFVGARFEHRKRDFLTDSVVLVAGPERKDTQQNYALTATWKPYRFLELSFALAHEKRSSNVAQLDYDANTASFMAQLTF